MDARQIGMKSLFVNVLGFPCKEDAGIAKLMAFTAAQIFMAEVLGVEISDVRRGNETVFWRVKYRARNYNCHSDGLFLDVAVTRVGRATYMETTLEIHTMPRMALFCGDDVSCRNGANAAYRSIDSVSFDLRSQKILLARIFSSFTCQHNATE
ncbi:hypothetical protein DB345_08545 [Spartobacteria bacterium LR76]|nr:hypothetical protein DB345_08545 [Spartobacteria bacterium LR76]